MRIATLILLAGFALSGCGRGPAGGSAINNTINNEPWFCQQAEQDDSWECIRSETLAQNPQPTRLPSAARPAPLVTAPAQVADSSTVSDAIDASNDDVAIEELTDEAASEQPENINSQANETATAADPITAPAPQEPAAIEDGETPVDRLPAATSDTNVPKHVALAYQPNGPVSLLDLPEDFWAVQLVAVSTREALEAFALEHQLKGMSAAQVASDDDIYYVLLLGIYESFDNAQQAIVDLPPPFDVNQPWIRQLGSLQTAMRAADDFNANR